MKAEFTPTVNVAAGDLCVEWFKNQTSDETAVKMVPEEIEMKP